MLIGIKTCFRLDKEAFRAHKAQLCAVIEGEWRGVVANVRLWRKRKAERQGEERKAERKAAESGVSG